MRLAVDIAALLLGCVIGALTAWRWGVLGGIGGFLAFSGLVFLRTEAQYWFEPDRDAGVLDAAVLSMGMGFAALWSGSFCLAGFFSRRRASSEGPT